MPFSNSSAFNTKSTREWLEDTLVRTVSSFSGVSSEQRSKYQLKQIVCFQTESMQSCKSLQSFQWWICVPQFSAVNLSNCPKKRTPPQFGLADAHVWTFGHSRKWSNGIKVCENRGTGCRGELKYAGVRKERIWKRRKC